MKLVYLNFLSFLYFYENVYTLKCNCHLRTKRMVNGFLAKPNLIPWQIAMYRGDKLICGGFIINEFWVMSATHCLLNKKISSLKIVVGTTNLTEIKKENIFYINKIITNPNFLLEKINLGYDIGLIKLNRKIKFISGHIEPACLNLKKYQYDILMASGYGTTKLTFFFRKTKLTHSDTSKNLKYTFFKEYNHKNSEKVIYTLSLIKGDDTCYGDSGGPLHDINSYKLSVVGITSFSRFKKVYYNTKIICYGETMFTRLSYYKYFIKKHLNSYCSV